MSRDTRSIDHGYAMNWKREKSESYRVPWVLVAAGFHRRGGMDRANAALADYLARQGTPVHLVAHHVAPELVADPNIWVHPVSLPGGSFLLGESLLRRAGQAIARKITARSPDARVLVNGGNCAWPDINWVHCVHRAWNLADCSAPAWYRVKNRVDKFLARRHEVQAFCKARLMLANSEQTREDLIDFFHLDPERVRTVYLGVDPDCAPATPAERSFARQWLGLSPSRPLVVFVGFLGYDCNKGFDVLLSAWKALCDRPAWDADLVAAGGGRGSERWHMLISQAGLTNRVRMLGFTTRVNELLAAADLLVSPVRYEAYGLNVQEAICRGIPAMVSRKAGVAERYPRTLSELIIPDPQDAEDLAARLLRWRSAIEQWKQHMKPFSSSLRARTWDDMAREIVELAAQSPPLN